MRALTQNMNRRHVMAQLAGRASVTLHTHLFFKGKVIVESGLVMKVRKNGAIVFIPRFGIEGIVYVAGRKEDKDVHLLFEYDEVAQRLTSRANPKNTIRVFDEVSWLLPPFSLFQC